VKTHMKSR